MSILLYNSFNTRLTWGAPMNSPFIITYTMNIYIKSDVVFSITIQSSHVKRLPLGLKKSGKSSFRLYFAKYIPNTNKHLPITFMIGIHKVYHISTYKPFD